MVVVIYDYPCDDGVILPPGLVMLLGKVRLISRSMEGLSTLQRLKSNCHLLTFHVIQQLNYIISDKMLATPKI